MRVWKHILVYTSIRSATMECMARMVHIKIGALTVSMPIGQVAQCFIVCCMSTASNSREKQF